MPCRVRGAFLCAARQTNDVSPVAPWPDNACVYCGRCVVCREPACADCDLDSAAKRAYHKTRASSSETGGLTRAGVIYDRIAKAVAAAPDDARSSFVLAAAASSDKAVNVIVCHPCYQRANKELADLKESAGEKQPRPEFEVDADDTTSTASQLPADASAPPGSARTNRNGDRESQSPAPPITTGQSSLLARSRDQLVAVEDPAAPEGYRRFKVCLGGEGGSWRWTLVYQILTAVEGAEQAGEEGTGGRPRSR